VSANANNYLTMGTDSKVYLNPTRVVKVVTAAPTVGATTEPEGTIVLVV
jgi:predicted RNase H-related nuclease YkuK (DUF458 family)